MFGFLMFLFLVIGAVVAGKWGYAKLTSPCGCHDKVTS
jgi:hypothetical protein